MQDLCSRWLWFHPGVMQEEMHISLFKLCEFLLCLPIRKFWMGYFTCTEILDFCQPTCRQDKEGRHYLASMGIYLFNKSLLNDMLNDNQAMHDFGKGVIPQAIKSQHVVRTNSFWVQKHLPQLGVNTPNLRLSAQSNKYFSLI